ncbi:hypothetical protein I601_2234 [Nocardioides dokdonensis FR1436]|uniref:Uncharacterized protein n=1 Tax=Nocardioides dokdonensis FR1436 TaxID=1300347 RepID=A0A1A9GK46_9ACTN|nr:hypothetical protein [Nocardioides dokdonensis]ANH38659.1 hypothetical protein I601_2234 [Nocardioides dokdonensis FR1436]
MTGSESRRRLLSVHQQALDTWAASDDANVLLGDDEFESMARRNRLLALRSHDPTASLGESLEVRLSSPQLRTGALSFAAGDTLLRPLEDTVSALGPRVVELEVTGISRGSTILHVRPVSAPEPPLMDGPPVDTSSADTAMRALVRMLMALEERQDVKSYVDGLVQLSRLSNALDKLDARLDVAWSASNGDRSSASFTDVGQTYLRSLMETRPREEVREISGRVTELRESGLVKVKSGVARNSPAFDVRFEPMDLLNLRLSLGENVHFLVRERREVDRLGTVHHVEWNFERVLSSQGQIETQ